LETLLEGGERLQRGDGGVDIRKSHFGHSLRRDTISLIISIIIIIIVIGILSIIIIIAYSAPP